MRVRFLQGVLSVNILPKLIFFMTFFNYVEKKGANNQDFWWKCFKSCKNINLGKMFSNKTFLKPVLRLIIFFWTRIFENSRDFSWFWPLKSRETKTYEFYLCLLSFLAIIVFLLRLSLRISVLNTKTRDASKWARTIQMAMEKYANFAWPYSRPRGFPLFSDIAYHQLM